MEIDLPALRQTRIEIDDDGDISIQQFLESDDPMIVIERMRVREVANHLIQMADEYDRNSTPPCRPMGERNSEAKK